MRSFLGVVGKRSIYRRDGLSLAIYSDVTFTSRVLPMHFVASALAHLQQPCPANCPHVCLSFAQSLDAKIAGAHGKQLPLSCPDSILMTHHIRSLHDAILVGVRTAINDDPQLNSLSFLISFLLHLTTLGTARLLPPSAPSPIPIVLDPALRFSPNARLLQNYAANTGRQPWVICSPPLFDRAPWQLRRDTLSQAGALIIELTPSQTSTLFSSPLSPSLIPP